MSDLSASFQGITQSDISIYKAKPSKKRSFIKRIDEEKDVFYQKLWILAHSIIFIIICCETIYILNNKIDVLSDFYGTQQQCCYCAWIARNGTFNEQRKIEYSHCNQYYKESYDGTGICTMDIDGNSQQIEYCKNNKDNKDNLKIKYESKVSTTSTFLFYPFEKKYIYYGILGLVLVFLYCSFIIISTFKYSIRLSSLLFVGNIVIAIQCYYNYYKAYQYTKTNYSSDAMCTDTPLPTDSNNFEYACYQNTVGNDTATLLRIMVNFFMVYFIYPVVFYIFSCFIKLCPYGHKCSIIQSYIERGLLYIGIVGGLGSIILCFVVLNIVISETNQFNLSWFHNTTEKYLCIIIGIILFIASLSVFCLPHCRQRCKMVVRARKIPKWKDAICDYDEIDDFDDNDSNSRRKTTEQSVNMTEIQTTSNKLSCSPLLEQNNK